MRVILCLYSTEGYYPQARVNKNVPILMAGRKTDRFRVSHDKEKIRRKRRESLFSPEYCNNLYQDGHSLAITFWQEAL